MKGPFGPPHPVTCRRAALRFGFRFGAGYGIGRILVGWGLYLVAFAWMLYRDHLAGRTGQSMGMRLSGLRLVGEQTGQPIGGSQGG
ncbi:MAG: RDD family protein [Actinobacteria bacterium]|nr:RDD family protein [Actinomycetota bacterium]